ncbi:MAG: hypothetical protein LIP01_16030 [Tannerellaceae bacterium]|nr:hypothetical protein [Tannerellaceae bacterium]
MSLSSTTGTAGATTRRFVIICTATFVIRICIIAGSRTTGTGCIIFIRVRWCFNSCTA